VSDRASSKIPGSQQVFKTWHEDQLWTRISFCIPLSPPGFGAFFGHYYEKTLRRVFVYVPPNVFHNICLAFNKENIL